MPRTPTGIKTVVVTLLFFLGALVASCGNDDIRLSPTAPATPEAMSEPQRPLAAASSATAPDARSVAASSAVPDVAQRASRVANFAAPQPPLSIFQAFDGALDELLDDLPVVIEQAMNAGQSKASVSASLVPGVLGIVGRLVTLTDDAYISVRPGAVNSSTTSSAPCTECSDHLTRCLDDALDNFVDCLFGCGAFDGGCRRRCKDAWRAEKSACYDAHRDCVRTCTPK